MKLTLEYHSGNPNLCRIPELKIKTIPECEGGGYSISREQAEALYQAVNIVHAIQSDEEWKSIDTAPRDGSKVWVYVAPKDRLQGYEGYEGYECWCAYHPNTDWYVDPNRTVTHWSPELTELFRKRRRRNE